MGDGRGVPSSGFRVPGDTGAPAVPATGDLSSVTAVVCRCREVMEEQVLEAVRDGARSVRGVKLRTHAGMGLCQGHTCGPLIEAILRRELGTAFQSDERPVRGPARPVALGQIALTPGPSPRGRGKPA